MKIAFIGGGSVWWTPTLVTDMALTDALAGATLVLHDIDTGALELLALASKRIVAQVGGSLRVATTTDRVEALRDADFVILCVSIGGLAAMRNDLQIPKRYGVYQSVGDTVGPGGLARGLRHIPFAVQVAREMEQLCPDAWLINLTNPMTTICRAVTRATSVRTVGLCHEVTGVRHRLAELFDVPVEAITLEVAGINHLPVVRRCSVGGRDGLRMLRDWLTKHGPFVLTLFEQLGVLFGAGDRHVAEFFPGFLTKASRRGRRYGIVITTVAQRSIRVRLLRTQIKRFVAGAQKELRQSEEQLAPVMAALAGNLEAQFIVNVPNCGQVDNLPRDAVVECIGCSRRVYRKSRATGCAAAGRRRAAKRRLCRDRATRRPPGTDRRGSTDRPARASAGCVGDRPAGARSHDGPAHVRGIDGGQCSVCRGRLPGIYLPIALKQVQCI